MNCARCGRNVYRGQYRCNCGHLLSQPKPICPGDQLRKMGLAREVGETEAEHAQRCREYLRKNRLGGILPKNAQRQLDEDEQFEIDERQAIQEEGSERD